MAQNVIRNIVAPTTEEIIKYELRCPRCKDHLGAPIYHCDRGHSFCNTCYKRTIECIICGSPFSGGRTHHLERIADLLTYHCKYSDQGQKYIECKNGDCFSAIPKHQTGCRKVCTIKKLKAHEEGCMSFYMPCPFKYEQKCAHVGNRLQTVFHCQLNHGSQTIMGDDDGENSIHVKLSNLYLDSVHNLQNHILRTIGKRLKHKTIFMLYIDHIIFLLVAYIDLDQVFFEAYRVSSPFEEEHQYELKMVFSFKDGETEPLTINLDCGVTNGSENVLVLNRNVVPVDPEAVKNSSHFAVQLIEKN